MSYLKRDVVLLESRSSSIGPHEVSVYATVDPVTAQRTSLSMVFDHTYVQSLLYLPARRTGFDCLRAFLSVPHEVDLSHADMLFLGGGGCSLPIDFATRHPDSSLHVVEHDQAVIDLATRHFVQERNIRLIDSSAEAYLRTTSASFDGIFIDTYSTMAAEAPCDAQMILECLERLHEKGSVMVNLPSSGMARSLAAHVNVRERQVFLLETTDSHNCLLWIPSTEFRGPLRSDDLANLGRYRCHSLTDIAE